MQLGVGDQFNGRHSRHTRVNLDVRRTTIIPIGDIAVVSLVWLIANAASLGWVYLSSQSKVSRSSLTSAAIITRATIVIALAFTVIYICIPLPVIVFAICSTVALLLAPVATFHGIGANDAILLPIYALKQFVLGFPDRDEFFLSPPEHVAQSDESLPLTNATGTVVAALKPCGTVKIGDANHPAIADDGKYLDLGTPIRVIAIRNSLLVVSAIANPKQRNT